MLNNEHITGLFVAAAEAVEEAIVNALLAGEQMHTADGTLVPALGAERLLQALGKVGWTG
ncbi:Peptidase family S58 [compost metagenome]